MSKISKSPERMTFQKEGYIKRCEEKGETPNLNYVNMHDEWLKQHDTRFEEPKSRVNNMEYDLLTTDWILEKVRNRDDYAQNLYAAMCNNDFTKREMWPILKEEKWSCSWRYAGGIIADMRQEGDYIDWYCSGIRNDEDMTEHEKNTWSEEQKARFEVCQKYVSESTVTEEIENDLYKLGWLVIKDNDA